MSSPSSSSIVVACVVDDAYAMPLAVTLTSASLNLRADRWLDLYIVDGGLSKASKARLVDSLPRNRTEIHWLRSTKTRLTNLPLWGRMSINTYERLLAAELLPIDVSRAIWLDSDLVVKADLGRLWDMNTDGHHILAVQDMIVPFVSSPLGIRRHAALGLDSTTEYFNAGVMLMNLDLWRRDEIDRQTIDYLRTHAREVLFWDQEALNVVLAGKWGALDPRWNQNSIVGRGLLRLAHLDPSTRKQVTSDPWIVHFSGNLKPWLYHNESAARRLYFSYLDMTAWVGWRPPRTVRTTLLGAYESSPARQLAYPLEKWMLRGWRIFTKVDTSAAADYVRPEPAPE